MKNKICCVAVVAVFIFASLVPVVAAWAGGWNLSGIATNIGKGPFISGFDIKMKFADTTGNSLTVTRNHQRWYVILGRKLPWWLYLGGSFGSFQNHMQGGLYITFTPLPFLKFEHWNGYGAGTPGRPKWDINDLFVSNSVYVTVSRYFSASLVSMEFLDEYTIMPGGRVSFPINGKYTVSFGLDYKMKGSGRGSLFNAGVAYTP